MKLYAWMARRLRRPCSRSPPLGTYCPPPPFFGISHLQPAECHTRARAHTHTHTHTHTPARTHAQARTHAHAHATCP